MTLKYTEYTPKYKQQVCDLFLQNYPKTSIARGYTYLKLAKDEHGLILVSKFLLGLSILFTFLLNMMIQNILISVIFYLILFHFTIFVIFPIMMNEILIWYVKNQIFKVDFQDIDEIFKDNNKFYLAINEENDEVAGMAAFTFQREYSGFASYSNNSGRLSRMSVRSSYANQGIATQLLKMAEVHAKELKLENLFMYYLSSNVAAYNLYKKNGYVKKEYVRYHYKISQIFGIKGQMMVKQIQL